MICIPPKMPRPRLRHRWPNLRPPKGSLSEVNTGDALFYKKHHMDGTEEAVYHVNIIDLLDRVFTLDAMRFLSIEQERFIDKFLVEADKINTRFENNQELYTDIDAVFTKLDHFLGNYMGVDENEYTR